MQGHCEYAANLKTASDCHLRASTAALGKVVDHPNTRAIVNTFLSNEDGISISQAHDHLQAFLEAEYDAVSWGHWWTMWPANWKGNWWWPSTRRSEFLLRIGMQKAIERGCRVSATTWCPTCNQAVYHLPQFYRHHDEAFLYIKLCWKPLSFWCWSILNGGWWHCTCPLLLGNTGGLLCKPISEIKHGSHPSGTKMHNAHGSTCIANVTTKAMNLYALRIILGMIFSWTFHRSLRLLCCSSYYLKVSLLCMCNGSSSTKVLCTAVGEMCCVQ